MSQTYGMETGAKTWEEMMEGYGLGAPPAQGMPSSMPGVQIGAPPQMDFNQQQFDEYGDQIGNRINKAYQYSTPQAQATFMDQSAVPNVDARQMQESDELKRLLSGEGYSPQTLAQMRATATEAPASAGLQQMSQMKRMLGQAGMSGSGAGVALRGEVARQTGQNQGAAMRDVDVKNAEAAMENTRFGVGQQSAIGMSNMQAANQMALANANMMFQALSQNQQASNQTNMMNTQIKAQQGAAGAAAQTGFLGQQGQQGQQQRFDTDMQNNQNQFNRQGQQAGFDWDQQRSQWQELNNRHSQNTNILGSWGQQ